MALRRGREGKMAYCTDFGNDPLSDKTPAGIHEFLDLIGMTQTDRSPRPAIGMQ